MRQLDWSRTSLGPVTGWPENLRLALGLCLTSRFPMHLWWGPDLTLFYNDAYIPFLGPSKHPAMLGRPGREAWAEIWDAVSPLINRARIEKEAGWSEDTLMFFDRKLPQEEAYVSFAVSPVLGVEDKVDGLCCTCSEVTGKIVAARRLETLRQLGLLAEENNAAEVCRLAMSVISRNPWDIPCAAVYLLDEDGQCARLSASTGLDGGLTRLPAVIMPGQPDSGDLLQLGELLEHAEVRELDLEAVGLLDDLPWPCGARQALALPLHARAHESPCGILLAGIGQRRPYDAEYRAFLELLAGQLARAISGARAYAEEKRRAEELAELERAKTSFFSNVSHEFRAPLTLMLGPIGEALADQQAPLPPAQEARLEMALGNGQRLLKLVNTLLDFSRLGRADACYRPTALHEVTARLAGAFRSAFEQAGVALQVECPPLPEEVWVDRDMWEKIVLNLLSNALKYTMQGKVSISLRAAGGHAVLSVADTGVGIAPRDVPHIFERFHHAGHGPGRSLDGAGIGLALVRDLAGLHGGTVEASSAAGKGSEFTVRIPLGARHLDQRKLGSADQQDWHSAAESYVQEALRWLATSAPAAERAGPSQPQPASVGAAPRFRVLVADDSADMRQYLRDLLAPYGDVEQAADGHAAADALASQRYDLLLADVKMPGMNGVELLRHVRRQPDLRLMSVVLISARVGEEARSEALTAGADDYLEMPFTARELVSRIGSCLALTRMRADAIAESELRFSAVQQASPDAFLIFAAVRDANGAISAFECQFANPAAMRILGKSVCGRLNGRTDEGLNPLFRMLAEAMEKDQPWQGEHAYHNGSTTRWLRSTAARAGERIALCCTDFTAHHEADLAMRQSEARQSFLLALSDNLRPLSCPCRIMDVACEAVGRQLKVAAVGYAEMQTDGETLLDGGGFGDGRLPSLHGMACRLSEFSPGFRRALLDGRARFVADLRRAPIERAGRAGGIYGRGVRATAVAPLVKDGRLVACLYAADAAPRNWTSQDRNLLREIADRTWSAVERARAEEALAVELKNMGRLQEMSTRMVKAKDLHGLLHEVLDATIELHGAFAGSIQLYDPDNSSLHLAAARGFDADFLYRYKAVRAGDGTPCGLALASVQRVIVEDIEHEPGCITMRGEARRAGFRAVQSTPLISHGGKVLGMLSTHFRGARRFTERELRMTDLYARHAADAIGAHLREQMRVRNSEVLESRVAERTQELQRALDALNREVLERKQAEDRLRQSEKLKAIGQLTGGIAHDFNNMLQTISGGLNLVRLRMQQGKLGEIEGYLRRAEKGTQRAAALTHRLLAFSRQQTLEPKCVSLGRIAREMEDMIRRAVGPSVQVEMQMGIGKWLVMCDPNQMESALLNLCVNARDAMPDGGWLTISTDELELSTEQAARYEGAAAGRYATIAVSDTGFGMTPEVLVHVFEPFFTTKPLGKGTGLGLSQIYGFVRQSGGFVQIESVPDKGTTVRICLPYNATDPEFDVPVGPDKGQTLLLVEDEQDVREMTGEQLRELGYRVLEADSGAAAMRLMQSGPRVDLLITDIGLPGGMDGNQVVGAMRQLMPVLPVIMISGYAAGPTAPDTEFLRKPFLVTDLAERVKAKLEARHP
ncbi:MAG TPA: ATP-binding protein [Pseudoduganella sp.]